MVRFWKFLGILTFLVLLSLLGGTSEKDANRSIQTSVTIRAPADSEKSEIEVVVLANSVEVNDSDETSDVSFPTISIEGSAPLLVFDYVDTDNAEKKNKPNSRSKNHNGRKF